MPPANRLKLQGVIHCVQYVYVCEAVIYKQKALKPSIHEGSKAMVEMTRVELVSENHLPELSTSIACGLTFPLRRAHRQAQRFSSL